MPPRDVLITQLDNPDLVADLISELRIIGTVGLLGFEPSVVPTFIVGSRGLTVTAVQVDFLPAQIFSAQSNNPAANAIITDTGPLPAGSYDIKFALSNAITVMAVPGSTTFEHRDAANAASLYNWDLTGASGVFSGSMVVEYAAVLAENERLRVRQTQAFTGSVAGTIAAKRRLTP